ncbi:DNA polymerase III subunit delta [Dehalobacter sp. DCM]|uniref:DNA polymerase III subunit delta n=1 Tax=Dehalobacter sp. DCM TaxID=2907827 RepID=UPI00308206A5|nr:DNA polymerase III subunit delta [Dehalobacter sp. DCM]
MTLDAVKIDIANNKIPMIYLWYGEDRYSLMEAVTTIKRHYLQEDPSGSNIEILNGKEHSQEDIVQVANTTAFFSGKLIIVDDFQYFNSGRSKGNIDTDSENEELESAGSDKGSDSEALLAYCQNPNPSSCLIVITEKVNKGRKLYKEINKCGKIIEFPFPKGQTEWIAWVQKEARQNGKSLNTTTASFLLDWAGHQTGILSQEIAKLALYTGEKQTIGVDDIQKICLPMIETTVFAMLDAIASGNKKEALRKMQEVLGQEHYLKVHTMIVRQIRLLLAASIWRSRRGTVNDFMETAGIRTPFEGNKIFQQAASFSPSILAKAMENCLQTELALKSSGGDPQLLLEMMVIRLCSK